MPAWFHLPAARRNRASAALLGRFAGLALSMLMTVVATHALLLGGASAEAPPGCAVCEEGYIYGTTGFAGSYAVATPDGVASNTYCITQGLNYPNSAHAGPVATDYADQAVWAALFDFAGPSDADKAAVSARVHRDLEGSTTEWNSFADLREHSDAMWNRAVAYSGPYATALEWRQRPDGSSGGSGVLAVAVLAASGNALPNAQVALSAANLAAPASVGTGPSGVVEIAVSALSAGPWSIEAVGTNLPPTTVVRYEALANEQTVVGPGARTSAAPARDSGTWDVPTAVTVLKVDAQTRSPLAGAQIEIRAADGSLAAAVTTADAPVPVALAAGEYTAREIREPDGYLIDDPAVRRFAVTMLGGRVELVWADTPATPAVRTRASAARVEPGAAVHDLITVTGLPPSLSPFPLRVRYLGPVPAPADGDCAALPAAAFDTAAVIGEATVTVSGNGDVRTPSFAAPAERGCTTFAVSSLQPLWPGGPILAAAPNDVDESVEVVSVALSTTIAPAVVEPGAAVRDTITITGLPVWAGVRTLTVELVGPVPRPVGGDCADLGEGAFDGAGTLASVTVDAAADGTIESPHLPVTVPDGQCVTIEIADAQPLWPGGPVVGSPRGLPSETALVRTAPTPAPTPTPTPPPSTPAPAAPTAQTPVAAPRPMLASTGPQHTRPLLAGGAALLGGGIGLLLLVPGAARTRRPAGADRVI